MVKELGKQSIVSEFGSHCVPHNSGLLLILINDNIKNNQSRTK